MKIKFSNEEILDIINLHVRDNYLILPTEQFEIDSSFTSGAYSKEVEVEITKRVPIEVPQPSE